MLQNITKLHLNLTGSTKNKIYSWLNICKVFLLHDGNTSKSFAVLQICKPFISFMNCLCAGVTYVLLSFLLSEKKTSGISKHVCSSISCVERETLCCWRRWRNGFDTKGKIDMYVMLCKTLILHFVWHTSSWKRSFSMTVAENWEWKSTFYKKVMRENKAPCSLRPYSEGALAYLCWMNVWGLGISSFPFIKNK